MSDQLISMSSAISSQPFPSDKLVNSNKVIVVSNCGDNENKKLVSSNISLDDQVLWRMNNYDSSDDERLDRLLRPESPKNNGCDKTIVRPSDHGKSSDYLDQLLGNDSVKSSSINARSEFGGGDCRLSDDERILNSKEESSQVSKSCDENDSVVNEGQRLQNSRVFFRSPPKADNVGTSRRREISDEEFECEGVSEVSEQVTSPSDRFGSIKVSIKSENSTSTFVRTVGVTQSESYRESNEAKTASAFEDPGSDSSSESDREFYRKLRTSHFRRKEDDVKVHPNYPGHTVPEEVVITDLPEIEELKDLTLEDDAYMQIVGHVMSVVGVLAIIKSANEAMALDADSILFNEDKSVFGKVFEVFGPVREPFYTVRFNNEADVLAKGVKVGLPVYCCLSDFDMTKVVFQSDLEHVKGSDASWRYDIEPPESALQYSDDEEERRAKRELKLKRRQKREEADALEELNEDDVEELNSSSENSDNDSGNEEKGKQASKKGGRLKSEKQSNVKTAKTNDRNKVSKLPSKISRPMGMSFSNSQENQDSSDDENDKCEETKRKLLISQKQKRPNIYRDKPMKAVAKVGYIEPIDVLYVKELNKKASPRKEIPLPPTPPVRDWLRSPSLTPGNSRANYQWKDDYRPKPAFNNPFESTATWHRPYNPHNASFARKPGPEIDIAPQSPGRNIFGKQPSTASGQNFQHFGQQSTSLPTDQIEKGPVHQAVPFQLFPSRLIPPQNGGTFPLQNVTVPENVSLQPQRLGVPPDNVAIVPQNIAPPAPIVNISPHHVSVSSQNVVNGQNNPGLVPSQQQSVPMRTIVIQVPADQVIPKQLVPFQQLPQRITNQEQCLQQLPAAQILSPPPATQLTGTIFQTGHAGNSTSNVETSVNNSIASNGHVQFQSQLYPRLPEQRMTNLPESDQVSMGTVRPTTGNSVIFQGSSVNCSRPLNVEFGKNPCFPARSLSFATPTNNVSNLSSFSTNVAPRMTSPFFAASSVIAESQPRGIFSQPVRFVTES